VRGHGVPLAAHNASVVIAASRVAQGWHRSGPSRSGVVAHQQPKFLRQESRLVGAGRDGTELAGQGDGLADNTVELFLAIAAGSAPETALYTPTRWLRPYPFSTSPGPIRLDRRRCAPQHARPRTTCRRARPASLLACRAS
jgi:hypothetical protein